MQDDHLLNSRVWHIDSVLGAEKTVLLQLSRLLERDGRRDDMLTSVWEACINAMEHGNGFSGDQQVTVAFHEDSHRYLFRIYDQGRGIAMPLPSPSIDERWDTDNPRGWGMLLIRELADSVRWDRDESGSYIELLFDRQTLGEEMDT
jgi:anti-sigma regulatory factor (Ser/Thr protein kinase)